MAGPRPKAQGPRAGPGIRESSPLRGQWQGKSRNKATEGRRRSQRARSSDATRP
jgi:hypothetical protein